MEFLWNSLGFVANLLGNLITNYIDISNILDLENNLETLKKEKLKLEEKRDSVRKKVEQAEQQHSRRPESAEKVDKWLKRVESILNEVNKILLRGEQEIQHKFLHYFPRNFWSSYNLGKEVKMKIEALRKKRKKKRLDTLVDSLSPPPVDEILVETTEEIDVKISEVWKLIEDPNVGIIGLCGQGGVGKTTLLKKLNNKFIHTTHHFDVIIWVTVSSEMNLEKVQNVIRNKLEIPDDRWKTRDENIRATEIHKELSRKRFVLLLDDVWAPIDWTEVGIPLPDDQNRSKIILTTRSEEVCRSMGVDRGSIYNVQCLSQEAALELFRHKVTDKVYSLPGIPKLAKFVVEECRGLPLALITIGRAMARRRNPGEWESAIDKLRSYPPKLFAGTGKEIIPSLKFSYDCLGDDMLKDCFLYCSLFPEDYEIRKDELIELWIAEGFFKTYGTLDDARNQGERAIRSLKHAGLLENVGDSEVYLKMHDVLRDMASLCISSKERKKIVVDDCKSIEEREDHGWHNTKRLSLWGWKIKRRTKIQHCRNLHTLLARETYSRKIPDGFLQSTQDSLKVLDLQGNAFLRSLPEDVSKFIKLQYLNLSDSSIKMLPSGIQNLRQLRILLLDGTRDLEAVPRGVISSLSSLQVFSRLSTRINRLEFQHSWETTLLLELERLEHIREIGLTLFTPRSFNQFESSHKLPNCIKRLIIDCSDYLPLDHIFHSTTSPAGYFQNLQDLYIANCPVKDLTCLKHSPRLRFVFAENCSLLEEIIACEFGPSEIEELKVFQHLKQLNFRHLPRLKSICRGVMPFPSLERIYVEECPNLRKLPLYKSVTNTSVAIVGDRDWWGQLDWKDKGTKLVFSSKFSAREYNKIPSFTYEATMTKDEIPMVWQLARLKDELKAVAKEVAVGVVKKVGKKVRTWLFDG